MAIDAQVSAFQERLNALEREINTLCASDEATEDFFRIFLEQVVSVLGVGGGVWQGDEAGQWTCVCHTNLAPAGVEEGGRQRDLAMKAVARVAQTGSAIVLPGNAGTNLYDGGLGEAAQNDSPHTLLFVPFVESRRVAAVLLLVSPEEVDPRAVRNYGGFVMGLCARGGVFLQKKRIDELNQELARAGRLREFVSALHAALDPRRVCYALANYGQEILGVYRCMAGTYSPSGKFRMEAVSGLEAVAVKSSFVRGIAEVCREVCRNRRPLLVDNPGAVTRSGGNEGDDLVTAARLYMIQAESKYLAVFPIEHEGRVVGALAVEKAVEEPFDQAQRRQCDALVAEAAPALANSIAYRHLPLSWLTRALARVRNGILAMSWARRLTWAVVIALLASLPFLIQREIKVVGTAELLARDARRAYAQHDGVIAQVTIPPDRTVEADYVLAALDTRSLESDIDRVNNQLAETRIALSEEVRLHGQSALARRLASNLEVLNAELNKLQRQLAEHQVTAPIAGMIVTPEDAIAQMLARPVARGEALFEIRPLQPDWQFSVLVPEDQAGELLRAWRNRPEGETLPARVILNAFPDHRLDTEVVDIAPRARVVATGERHYRNVIEIYVRAPEGLLDLDPRQGMEGKVAIDCGQRSLIYAVTHDFVNFLRRRLF